MCEIGKSIHDAINDQLYITTTAKNIYISEHLKQYGLTEDNYSDWIDRILVERYKDILNCVEYERWYIDKKYMFTILKYDYIKFLDPKYEWILKFDVIDEGLGKGEHQ